MYSFLSPEPISCFIPGSHCCFLTHIQVSQEIGKMVWYSHLFKSFPHFVMIHTSQGFCVVKTEGDVFLEFPCFLYGSVNAGNLISQLHSSDAALIIIQTWVAFSYKCCLSIQTHINLHCFLEFISECSNLHCSLSYLDSFWIHTYWNI